MKFHDYAPSTKHTFNHRLLVGLTLGPILLFGLFVSMVAENVFLKG